MNIFWCPIAPVEHSAPMWAPTIHEGHAQLSFLGPADASPRACESAEAPLSGASLSLSLLPPDRKLHHRGTFSQCRTAKHFMAPGPEGLKIFYPDPTRSIIGLSERTSLAESRAGRASPQVLKEGPANLAAQDAQVHGQCPYTIEPRCHSTSYLAPDPCLLPTLSIPHPRNINRHLSM